jgi:ABC-type taurine transport system ATPase subunit
MPGLRARRLEWQAADGRRRVEPDPVVAEPGCCVGVLAPGPAGRMLADLLTGVRTALAGSVTTDGDVPVRPGAVALVPAGGAVLPHLTVEANIAYGPAFRGREQRRAEVEPAARLLQVDSLLDLPAGRLSPGQRLRVGLARAVAARPLAVVVEDRAGAPPCAAAVAAVVDAGFAVLVVTDDADRLPPTAAAVHLVVTDDADRLPKTAAAVHRMVR